MAHIARCEICLSPVRVVEDDHAFHEFCPACDVVKVLPVTEGEQHELRERCVRLIGVLNGWV